MTRTIFAVGGVPASGKSTLTQAFMKAAADDWEDVELQKLIPSHFSKSANLHVLGKYKDGDIFGGTDKMSMAAAPEAKKFLAGVGKNSNVYFEGDRLFIQSILEMCTDFEDTNFFIVFLQTDERTLDIRHKKRADTQTEQFLKGRETKYENLKKNFLLMDYIFEHYHETPEDTQKIIEWMKERLNGQS